MASKNPVATVIAADGDVPNDKTKLRLLVQSMVAGTQHFAGGVWSDFKMTNQSTAGSAAKFAAGLVVGGKVATQMGAVTPVKWAASGFGALPAEFTKSGAIQVFQYSFGARAAMVAKAAAVKFALVTLAYEGGVLIGAVINQTLSDDTKDAIGGTINEIINEGGWKLLWKHPFGIGM